MRLSCLSTLRSTKGSKGLEGSSKAKTAHLHQQGYPETKTLRTSSHTKQARLRSTRFLLSIVQSTQSEKHSIALVVMNDKMPELVARSPFRVSYRNLTAAADSNKTPPKTPGQASFQEETSTVSGAGLADGYDVRAKTKKYGHSYMVCKTVDLFCIVTQLFMPVVQWPSRAKMGQSIPGARPMFQKPTPLPVTEKEVQKYGLALFLRWRRGFYEELR